MLELVKKNRNKLLKNMLNISDNVASAVFKMQSYDVIIEMGVHQGEIARHIYKAEENNYIGYEANIHNIQKYKLADLNVQNFAVIPANVFTDKIELNIPVRNKGDDLTSGKSSVLTRDLNGWYSNQVLEVNTIKVDEMPFLKEKSLQVGVWIDIEGLSTKIADEISYFQSVNFIHFEYDINGEDYQENVFSDLKNIKENFYLLRFRTSHNQYNYFAIKQKTCFLILLKCLSEIHNIIVELLLLPSRHLKKK